MGINERIIQIENILYKGKVSGSYFDSLVDELRGLRQAINKPKFDEKSPYNRYWHGLQGLGQFYASDHPYIYKVIINIEHLTGVATITDMFMAQDKWHDGSNGMHKLFELNDDETLDALKAASEIGKQLESEGWIVKY